MHKSGQGLRRGKGEELCGRRAGKVEDGRLVAGEDGFLAPRPPPCDNGRRGIGGDGPFEGGQMADVTDHAAMVAAAVVVGVNGDGGTGLKTGKALQQKQDKRGTDTAIGNATWNGPAHGDSLSI